MNDFKNKIEFLGSPNIFFFTVLWLIFLLVAGTIAQKDIGLYAAQEKYFSSMIIWIGFLPLPAGYLTMIVIFINLLAKLIIEKWTKAKTGTVIIHVGALLLLFGGFVKSEFSSEGNMIIKEGESSSYVADYHKREIVFSFRSDGKYTEITFPEKHLKAGQILTSADLPFSVEVLDFCRNCQLVKRAETLDNQNIHGLLKTFKMQNANLLKEDELNISGVNLALKSNTQEADGKYAIFEQMPIRQNVEINGTEYDLQIRRQRTYLPFTIELINFEKQLHPATNKPRSYSSEVILKEGDLKWHSLIEMNQPLRYKGYTFFQSSFIESPDGDSTVLAAVKNYGRLFPYISSIIICIGLLVHLFQRVPTLMRKKK